MHDVVEEKLAVSRNHHDLQFVREALGYDFVDQQRILFQDRGLARHTLGVGGGGQAYALGLGLRQKFAALALGFAVDELGLAGSFGILDRRFLSRFGEPVDLNLPIKLEAIAAPCILAILTVRSGDSFADQG